MDIYFKPIIAFFTLLCGLGSARAEGQYCPPSTCWSDAAELTVQFEGTKNSISMKRFLDGAIVELNSSVGAEQMLLLKDKAIFVHGPINAKPMDFHSVDLVAGLPLQYMSVIVAWPCMMTDQLKTSFALESNRLAGFEPANVDLKINRSANSIKFHVEVKEQNGKIKTYDGSWTYFPLRPVPRETKIFGWKYFDIHGTLVSNSYEGENVGRLMDEISMH